MCSSDLVILLGIVSVATAYTSFQSSLYDGQRADSISLSEAAGTEAESLYLEGNQQYVQDSQTIQQLALLQVAIDGGDPLRTPWYWLVIAGLGLAIAGFVFMRLTADPHQGCYVRAYVDANGKTVDGHFTDDPNHPDCGKP